LLHKTCVRKEKGKKRLKNPLRFYFSRHVKVFDAPYADLLNCLNLHVQQFRMVV